jgi:hypothetical protein
MSTRDSQSIKFDEQQATSESYKLQASNKQQATSNNQEQSSKIQDPRFKSPQTRQTTVHITYSLAIAIYLITDIYYST